MWKIVLGFVVFAVVVLFVLKQAGGNIDMGGEKHGIETESAAASEPASAASR